MVLVSVLFYNWGSFALFLINFSILLSLLALSSYTKLLSSPFFKIVIMFLVLIFLTFYTLYLSTTSNLATPLEKGIIMIMWFTFIPIMLYLIAYKKL